MDVEVCGERNVIRYIKNEYFRKKRKGKRKGKRKKEEKKERIVQAYKNNKLKNW